MFLSINTFGAVPNWTVCTPNDSTYYSNVVKLIHDYKSLKSQYENKVKYSDSLIVYIDAIEYKLKKTREYLKVKSEHSDRYKKLYEEVSYLLKDTLSENIKLNKQIKRTRRIGIGFGIVAFVVGLFI